MGEGKKHIKTQFFLEMKSKKFFSRKIYKLALRSFDDKKNYVNSIESIPWKIQVEFHRYIGI